jgi:phosphoenolpyruvate synthase/pyruvate phosphate dikinase
MTRLSYRLTDEVMPGLHEVGSKGLSLMRLVRARYPVPPGFILTTAFFDPWLKELQQTPAWAGYETAPPQKLAEACRYVQHAIAGYTLNPEQGKVVAAELGQWSRDTLFAVRSSAVAEDLMIASFAGAYKTALGVRWPDVAHTLPAIVASSFNPSLVAYVRQLGLAQPPIAAAVLVQEQLSSEIAGVAFSVNPVSRDPTQAVIEANWGLGKTVVDGTISPDYFVVDKATRTIIERRLGRKERSLVVTAEGQIQEREDHQHDQWTLDETTIQHLTNLLVRLECEQEHAIDMEWGIKNRQIMLLQIRPITNLLKPSG